MIKSSGNGKNNSSLLVLGTSINVELYQELSKWNSSKYNKPESSSPSVDRPNTIILIIQQQRFLLKWHLSSPSLPNFLLKTSPENLVADQRITDRNPINIMYPPDNQCAHHFIIYNGIFVNTETFSSFMILSKVFVIESMQIAIII